MSSAAETLLVRSGARADLRLEHARRHPLAGWPSALRVGRLVSNDLAIERLGKVSAGRLDTCRNPTHMPAAPATPRSADRTVARR